MILEILNEPQWIKLQKLNFKFHLMSYIGLDEQIRRNNRKSVLLLLSFPLLILLGVYAFYYLTFQEEGMDEVNLSFLKSIPVVAILVGVWFLIAFTSHTAMIKASTGARSLTRKENKGIYNLTENLCMSVGMKTPKIFIIDSPVLNAYASGINDKTYAVTLTRGIIDKLEEKELEGVIAHELTHIRNRDVRLLIISIIFVGIFAFAVNALYRLVFYSGRRRNKNDKVDGRIFIVALLIAVVAYFLSILFKFALSRKREYLADAGAVEMTKNPEAMANALRKISGNSNLESRSDDVKQLFIDNSPKKGFFSTMGGLFSTHPPIEKRIQFLDQM